jgi:hypothetical protein
MSHGTATSLATGSSGPGEAGFELAEEGCVRLRFEQGDSVVEEGQARRGVGVWRSAQTPVRGENLAGFLHQRRITT